MRKILVVLVLVTGCTEFPVLDQGVSEASLSAPYPKLIALDGQGDLNPEIADQGVIDELDGRSSSLWARIGVLFK